MAAYAVPMDDVVGLALARTRTFYDKVKLAEDRLGGAAAAAIPKRMENDLQWLKMIRCGCGCLFARGCALCTAKGRA